MTKKMKSCADRDSVKVENLVVFSYTIADQAPATAIAHAYRMKIQEQGSYQKTTKREISVGDSVSLYKQC